MKVYGTGHHGPRYEGNRLAEAMWDALALQPRRDALAAAKAERARGEEDVSEATATLRAPWPYIGVVENGIAERLREGYNRGGREALTCPATTTTDDL